MQKFAVTIGEKLTFQKLNSDGRRQIRRKNEGVEVQFIPAVDYWLKRQDEDHRGAVARKMEKIKEAEKGKDRGEEIEKALDQTQKAAEETSNGA